MGISFKVSKSGTRFRPKLAQPDPPNTPLTAEKGDGNSKEQAPLPERGPQSILSKRRRNQAGFSGAGNDVSSFPISSTKYGGHLVSPDHKASFSVNLFPDGFSIGKPTEDGVSVSLLEDVPKLLHPYDRTSEALFSAIESGCLPGDILDDIPCKYINGTLVCEVRDYRDCISKQETSVFAGDKFPNVYKVHLQMSMENVVKDIPLISDDSWTYRDLLEVESRILKALQPKLCLDPTPSFGRLSEPASNKLNLAIFAGKQMRKRGGLPALSVVSNNLSHGKKISINGLLESSISQPGPISGDDAVQYATESATRQPVIMKTMPALQPGNIGQVPLRQQAIAISSQPKYQPAIGYSIVHNETPRLGSGNASTINPNFVSALEQDLARPYNNVRNSDAPLGKRDGAEAQLMPKPDIKRSKQEQVGFERGQHQHHGGQMDTLHGTEFHWKSTLLQQQLGTEKLHYVKSGSQKNPQQLINERKQAVLERVPKQEAGIASYLERRGAKYNVKEELIEAEKSKDGQNVDKESDQPLLPRIPSGTRTRFFPQTQWPGMGQIVEKDPKGDDAMQKKTSLQSPHVSSGGMVHSPVSSKSGEVSSSSLGTHHSTTPGLQKEKTAASVNSGHNDSVLRQNQAHLITKRKPNSISKAPGTSGAGSPASMTNLSAPLSANSPSIGTPPMPALGPSVDPDILERFLRIDMVTQRYKLNSKRQKVDAHFQRKPLSHCAEMLSIQLSNAHEIDDLKDVPDTRTLARSLLGGSFNVCKTRCLNFLRSGQIYQGNGISVVVRGARNKLIMSEKPKDGMVEAMVLHGDEEETDFLAFPQDYLPTLPNTHYADLYAAQFTSLMIRDSYELIEDLVQPIAARSSVASSSQPTVPISLGTAAPELPHQPPTSSQSTTSVASLSSGISSLNPLQMSSSQNSPIGGRIMPPGSLRALQLSAGYFSRQQQLDLTNHLSAVQRQPHQQSSIQQQHPQIQRSLELVGNKPIVPVGQNALPQISSSIVNTPSHLQFQLLQRQQQQPMMQRKMIVGGGVGTSMGLGNVGPIQPSSGAAGLGNILGLGTMSNAMAIGGLGAGISAPMGHIPTLGTVGPVNVNQASAIGSLNQQIHPGVMSHTQAAALASKFRLSQSRGRGMMSGNGQMHGCSPSLAMPGQTLGRDVMSPLQRGGIVSMAPPKISAMNYFITQQQQQQQLQKVQPQPLLQQQQQTGSPLLQTITSGFPQQVGSPPSLSVPQQQVSPQQEVSQQGPMSPQLSSGAAVGSGSPLTDAISHAHAVVGPGSPLPGGAISHSHAGAGPGSPSQAVISHGHAVAGPGSPQLSSQTLGSLGSITSSPMELQGLSKGNYINNTS